MRGVSASGWGLPVAVVVSALAVWAGVAVVRRFAPETSGSGIPLVEAVLHRGRDMRWPRILWVKFTGGVLAIGGGLTLGREGPAFNAPLAGTLFVLEEMRVLRTPRHALAALLACVTADQVYRGALGGAPQLGLVGEARAPLSLLLPLLLVGAAAGVLGAVFNRCLLGTLGRFGRLRARAGRHGGGLPLLVGALVGLVGFFAPLVLGPGDALIERALATGAAGGLFAPLLVLGAESGVLIGRMAEHLRPVGSASLPVFAIVGMGALFASSVRAPATGVLLMIEMTGALSALLPLAYGAILADLTARALGARPIYEALLERTLAREGDTL